MKSAISGMRKVTTSTKEVDTKALFTVCPKPISTIYESTKKFLKSNNIPTNYLTIEQEEESEENNHEKNSFIVFYLPSKYNDIELLVNSSVLFIFSYCFI